MPLTKSTADDHPTQTPLLPLLAANARKGLMLESGLPEPDGLRPTNEQEAISLDVGPVKRLIELTISEAIADRATDMMFLNLHNRISLLFCVSDEWRERDRLPEWLWHLILARLHRMLAVEQSGAMYRAGQLSFPEAQPPTDMRVRLDHDRVVLSLSTLIEK